MIRSVRWLWVGVMCLLLVGCGLWRQSVPIDYDNPLVAKLSALEESGQSASLNTLTDFGWDQVYLFHEAASREDIEKAAGTPVIKDKYYDTSASLLLFKQEGRLARVIGIVGDYLRSAGAGPFGPDVMVEPWGNGALRLTVPGAEPR